MARQRTFSGWAIFVLTACSKSFLDISYFRRDGTFDTVFYGRQAFWSHPAWCCVNIMLDTGAVLGAILTTRDAIVARWSRAGR